MSIAYGSHALGLGPANPTRTYLASEPSGYRRPGFPPGFSLLMPASALPRGPPRLPPRLRPGAGRSPTKDPREGGQSAASAAGLAPVDCRRTRTRPVSYYALFQGWLLLSQPPGCLRARTSLHTQPALGGLSRRSRLFPSRPRSLAPVVSLPPWTRAHSAFAGGRYPRRALAPAARYLTRGSGRRCTSMHFGENQLSPGSLGISPLPTAPPTALQRGTVRASSGWSPRITLAMGSSPGFGPTRRDSRPSQTRLRSGSGAPAP